MVRERSSVGLSGDRAVSVWVVWPTVDLTELCGGKGAFVWSRKFGWVDMVTEPSPDGLSGGRVACVRLADSIKGHIERKRSSSLSILSKPHIPAGNCTACGNILRNTTGSLPHR